MQIILVSILLLVLVYIGICSFYYFFQSKMIFVPMGKKSHHASVVLASEFDEYFLETPYEGLIHAVHIKTSKPRGCILYFHGNTGGITRWGAIAEELTSFGFDIFLPDYRGYGKSRGKRTEETIYSDALVCYKKVAEMYAEAKICIYGRSLGTAPASWLSARVNAAAVVLETPFNNLIEVARYHSKIIPVQLFLKFSFRNDLHLRRSRSPVLIVHGTKDKLVPYASGLRLFKNVKDKVKARMLTIPGGKHNNLNGYPVLRDTLYRFFDRYFGKE